MYRISVLLSLVVFPIASYHTFCDFGGHNIDLKHVHPKSSVSLGKKKKIKYTYIYRMWVGGLFAFPRQ